jgi:hypothetical protein
MFQAATKSAGAAWQQSAHTRITEPLFFVFVALLVQRQGFVIEESARAGKASQVAKLFAIRQGFEFVALHPEHGIIVISLWQDIKTFAPADTVSSQCTYTGSSSESIGIEFRSRYWKKGVLWSRSYFAASCGGAPINILEDHIRQQKTPL